MANDESWRDEPYTAEELLRPGFDPFEAHLAWLARKREREEDPAYLPSAHAAAMQRIDRALAKLKRRKKRKPKPVDPWKAFNKAQRKEQAESIRTWKSALAAIKNAKR